MLTQRIQVSMNMPIILKPRNLVPTKLNNRTVGPYYKENERNAPVNILPARGGAAGIHGALDRRPFLTGGNLINLWNPGPG